MNTILDLELMASRCDNFSDLYQLIHKSINVKGETLDSRNGEVREFLNFKTNIQNPYKRLVGGGYRNINPFFLLAEALWIFSGRRDVKFLKIFNERMEDFSDDRVNFHAPYGWRMRKYGLDSFNPNGESLDQFPTILKMLSNDPEDRRAVISIWNPFLDLGTISKDIPCNDMVMFKIRKGKLNFTVQNRSNDLHWGLPTNVFQFSFVSELLSLCLGIELGNQIHNSDSLHVYTDPKYNPVNSKLDFSNFTSNGFYSLVTHRKIDYNFLNKTPVLRLSELDLSINCLIGLLFDDYYGLNTNKDKFYVGLQEVFKSNYLKMVFELLTAYSSYKKKDLTKIELHTKILEIAVSMPLEEQNIDVLISSLNFTFNLLNEEDKERMRSFYAEPVVNSVKFSEELTTLLRKHIGKL
jgi:hypothetical protein